MTFLEPIIMAVGDSMRYQKCYVRTVLADIHVSLSFRTLGFLYIKIKPGNRHA